MAFKLDVIVKTLTPVCHVISEGGFSLHKVYESFFQYRLFLSYVHHLPQALAAMHPTLNAQRKWRCTRALKDRTSLSSLTASVERSVIMGVWKISGPTLIGTSTGGPSIMENNCELFFMVFKVSFKFRQSKLCNGLL